MAVTRGQLAILGQHLDLIDALLEDSVQRRVECHCDEEDRVEHEHVEHEEECLDGAGLLEVVRERARDIEPRPCGVGDERDRCPLEARLQERLDTWPACATWLDPALSLGNHRRAKR